MRVRASSLHDPVKVLLDLAGIDRDVQPTLPMWAGSILEPALVRTCFGLVPAAEQQLLERQLVHDMDGWRTIDLRARADALHMDENGLLRVVEIKTTHGPYRAAFERAAIQLAATTWALTQATVANELRMEIGVLVRCATLYVWRTDHIPTRSDVLDRIGRTLSEYVKCCANELWMFHNIPASEAPNLAGEIAYGSQFIRAARDDLINHSIRLFNGPERITVPKPIDQTKE